MEGELEKTVKRGATGIDGGYTCRCEDDMFLLGGLGDVAEKRRFTRACLSGKEKRATGKLYDLQSFLKLFVVKIDMFQTYG